MVCPEIYSLSFVLLGKERLRWSHSLSILYESRWRDVFPSFTLLPLLTTEELFRR